MVPSWCLTGGVSKSGGGTIDVDTSSHPVIVIADSLMVGRRNSTMGCLVCKVGRLPGSHFRARLFEKLRNPITALSSTRPFGHSASRGSHVEASSGPR
jgi:hypothetical protein